MAEMVYAADVLYPEYSGGDDIDDIKQYVLNVQDYLFLLREGLGYTLGNLGMQNFNQTAFTEIADVIRKPVQVQLTDQEGRLVEIETSLDGISTTVSSIDGNFVKLSGATQTASGFEFTIRDGSNNAAVIMDAAGLTVYKGNIVIKNNDNTNVFYADQGGNLVMTGTIQGSSVYGSTIITCAASDVATEPHFYIGTENGEPLIQSYNGATASGFQAVGDASDPYYGLFIAQTVDYRTWYDSATGTVHTGVDGSKAFIGCANGEVGFAYNDPANNIQHYINVKSTGLYLVGNVYINGVLQ